MREIIVLDLQKSAGEFSYEVYLRGRRGDKRSLARTFQITDDGDPLDLTGLTVTFMAYTPNGEAVMDTVETEGSSGQFTYSFPAPVLAVSGDITLAYFRVEDSENGWIGSTNSMRIEILGDVALTDDVTGAYVPLLDQIIEAADELAANSNSVISEASAAIGDCNSATAAADAAAQAAIAASSTNIWAVYDHKLCVTWFAGDDSDLTPVT